MALIDRLNLKPNNFVVPVSATALAIIYMIVAPEGTTARLAGIVLTTAAILLTLHAADMAASSRHAATAVMIGAALLSSYGTATGRTEVHAVGNILAAAPILFSAAMVLRWIGRQARKQINLQAVVGGVLVYLLIGLMFSWVIGAVIDLDPATPYFCTQPNVSNSDRVYFSFSTITTTGFGDYVPCTQVGHALAVTETVFGQVYLVTIIALLVGNLGRSASPRRGGGDGAADDADEASGAGPGA